MVVSKAHFEKMITSKSSHLEKFVTSKSTTLKIVQFENWTFQNGSLSKWLTSKISDLRKWVTSKFITSKLRNCGLLGKWLTFEVANGRSDRFRRYLFPQVINFRDIKFSKWSIPKWAILPSNEFWTWPTF